MTEHDISNLNGFSAEATRSLSSWKQWYRMDSVGISTDGGRWGKQTWSVTCMLHRILPWHSCFTASNASQTSVVLSAPYVASLMSMDGACWMVGAEVGEGAPRPAGSTPAEAERTDVHAHKTMTAELSHRRIMGTPCRTSIIVPRPSRLEQGVFP
jgi:hypothetical protein